MEIAVVSVFFVMGLFGVILILLYVIGILFEFTILQSIFYCLYKGFVYVCKIIYELVCLLFSHTDHVAKPPASPGVAPPAQSSSSLPEAEAAKDGRPRCQCGAILSYPGAYCAWCGRGEKKNNETSQ